VREVDSFAALTGTEYGRLLLIKLGLVVGVLGLGAVSRYAVRRASNTVGRLRYTVPLEIGLISVVLAITAMLVVTPPAREAPAMSEPAPGPTQVVLKVPAGGEAQLTVEPAAVGMNKITVTVMDAQGHPWHVPEVTVRATLPERQLGPFDVHVTADGHIFAGHVDLPLPGAWRIDITVRTSDIDAYVISSQIRVNGGKPR
jgi:copper transport protein